MTFIFIQQLKFLKIYFILLEMSTEEKETFEHDIYKYCKDEKEADAVAWAFVNPKKNG